MKVNDASPYERFRALHEGTKPFIMPNAWDAASAVLLKREGFLALGTTSYAIALSLGVHDGRHAVSRDTAVANGTLLARASGLPINGDLEDGFGPAPEDCALTVSAAIAAGLAGLGIEDTTADPARPIHAYDDAIARIRTAATAARGRIVLTGRTDNFINDRPDLDDTIRRLSAFAEAGADVLYAPGLPDLKAVAAVVRAVAPKPVNVLWVGGLANASLAEFAEIGVRRISLGSALYIRTLGSLVDAARALRGGDARHIGGSITGSEIADLFSA
ncbi:MAG: isocitrate lyase/phosphoenolpyruvate mutase family protein [Candidatus Eremiobacteraeota bacterium]|nr:isocitrate lyase/phosphoenolpyruvate mutase family protein [Candidatus Eremiobacteraeota bacterium]